MATFGNRPEDSVTDSKGNVRPGVVITVFASEADAISNRNSIGSASAGSDGRWPIELAGRTVVWAREPNGSVWSVASDTALSDHETRLDTVETELPNKLEAADISGKADVTYVDTGLAAKIDTATANSTYEAGSTATIYVDPAGNDSRPGKTASTAKATIAAAVAALGADPGTIVLSTGTHIVGSGLSLSGSRASIIGQGAGETGRERTAIYAPTQSGPVIDWTGYLWPSQFEGRVEFGNFAIVGSGVADATKNNVGARIAKTVAAGSAYWHDIGVRDTGGPGFEIGFAYLCDFERLTVVTPVSAKANDVPYFQLTSPNQNRFIGLGLRSITSSADCGVSGALVIKTNAPQVPMQNLFLGTWFEFLHVPTNGCLISIQGNANEFFGTMFADISKESGATGTAYFRLIPPPTGDVGGNAIRGYIPGHALTPTSVDVGVDVQQNGNLIEGVKGYNGSNVQIAAGVTGTTVNLGGVEGDSQLPAVINNSAGTRNTLIDQYNRSEIRNEYTRDAILLAGGRSGPRFAVPSAVANGAVFLGQSGVSVEASGATGYSYADVFRFRTVAGATKFQIDNATAPGITFPDHGTLPTATSTLRGKVVVVQGATGVADQVYVCRKNAADAYEWAALA